MTSKYDLCSGSAQWFWPLAQWPSHNLMTLTFNTYDHWPNDLRIYLLDRWLQNMSSNPNLNLDNGLDLDQPWPFYIDFDLHYTFPKTLTGLTQINKIYVIYIMDSEQVRITPSEKTKLYLTKNLSEIEIKLKRMKKKKIIIQTIGSILIIGSKISSVLIASLVFPPIVVTSLSVTSAIMSGLSIKMNFSAKSKKISKLLTKLNQLQIKLDYVVSCNGDLTEDEYQSILRDFEYWKLTKFSNFNI